MNIKIWQSAVFLGGRCLALTGCVLVLFLFTGATSGYSSQQVEASGNHDENTKATITIDVSKTQGAIDAHAFGIIMGNKGNEVPELTHFFRTPDGQQKLRELGVKTLSLWADRDDWAHPYSAYTAVPEAFPTVMYTTEYLTLNQLLGSEPMISVNITNLCHPTDTGAPPSSANVTCQMATPELAKSWLSFIKKSGIRKVKYVQLGAEPYAGCLYWQAGKNVNCTVGYGEHKIALTQQEYATRVLAWATALRKVDPNIKLGIHLQPNTFLCANSCNNISWDETLLKKVGSKIDFVITHQYYELDEPATTEQEAQRLSYYQEQRDVRVSKNGVTAIPRQIRQELIKWLPSKKNIPIVMGEFNTSRMDSDQVDAVPTRMSLYSSMAVAEGYLDMLAPAKIKGVTYPGALRVIFLDLHNIPVLISRYLPLDNPQTLVYAPAWHMFSMLKSWQGKTLLAPKIKGNAKTSYKRPLLRAYAVKKNKDVWLAVFNHEMTTSRTLDVSLVGLNVVNAQVTVIGDTASSLLTANSAESPNALSPTTTTVPSSQVKKDRLAGMVFPPHSMTVIHIHGK